MPTEDDWFEVCEGDDLMQGDLLRRVPRFTVTGVETWPPGPSQSPDVEVDLVDAIILTQSCDLEQDKVHHALLAPVIAWTQVATAARARGDTYLGSTASRNNIQRGHQPGLVLLRKFEPDASDPSLPRLPWSVVNMKELFLAPVSIVRSVAAAQGRRLRLRPGYRGFLAQAFGAYFMRPDHLDSTAAFVTEGKLD